MNALDKRIIQMMQDEFPLVEEPFKELAQRAGIGEDELIERLKRYKQEGQIRKMGAVLRHREVGYSSNVLCAWVVPEDRLGEVAASMAENPAVSHCYERNTLPEWPYNVYTMIHGHSRKECNEIAGEIAGRNHLTDKAMLYSVKEWKKTSMRYFCEKDET